MTDHAHVATARAAFEAFNSGDWAAWTDYFSEGATLHNVVSSLPFTLYGRDSILGFMQQMSAAADGTMHHEIESALADDRYLMLFTRATVQRPGKSLDIVFVIGCEVDADGKWTQMWFGTDDPAALEAFWAGPAPEPVGA